MSAHHCHAKGCPKIVPPKLLMCLRHWRMIPKELQKAVWATYRPGQEADKRPSEEYLKAARAAIDAVAAKEAVQQPLDLTPTSAAAQRDEQVTP